jgi:hypothetical protein
MDGRAVNLSLGLESKHVCVELKPRRVEEVRQWRGPPWFNSFGGWSVTCGAFRVEKCSRQERRRWNIHVIVKDATTGHQTNEIEGALLSKVWVLRVSSCSCSDWKGSALKRS